MKVKVTLSIGYPQAVQTTTLDIEGWEDMNDDQQFEIVNEWAQNYISIYWDGCP